MLLPIVSARGFAFSSDLSTHSYNLGEIITDYNETRNVVKPLKSKASTKTADIILLVGESTELFVNVKDSNGNPVTDAPLKWSASPEGVVSLKQSADTRYVTIMGLSSKNNPATVTVSLGETTKSVTVEVVEKNVVAQDGTTISLSEEKYECYEGEEIPLSGELYSPKGTNEIELEWSVSGEDGVSINTPASMLNTDAYHIIFSTLAKGMKEGRYTVTVKTSNGARSTRRVVVSKKENIGHTSPSDGEYKLVFNVGFGKFKDGTNQKVYYFNEGDKLSDFTSLFEKPSKSGFEFITWTSQSSLDFFLLSPNNNAFQ